MNLEQLANLGELIGGVAVVASLIYLAVQIRQNTRMVKSSTLFREHLDELIARTPLAQGDIVMTEWQQRIRDYAESLQTS
ncbi:MAG: hypothetical protein ISP91_13320 [Pseudomonadales bacterium]|jgi:hypothetical protein|nr:hypothetical protein [Pseudomonadales bacterium]